MQACTLTQRTLFTGARACACVQEEQLALYFRRKSVPEALQKRIEDYYE